MKQLKYFVLLLLFIGFWGCEENPVGPDSTVEERINGNRPFYEIIVNHTEYTYFFSKQDADPWNRIRDAYANDGYFVVVTDDHDKKTYYFNLFSIKNLETRKGYLTINY
ncbi:hypothetical protein MNBD_IGNAVI01-3063 [hydrothermal vent metagenome]|uniref:Uncharacterized protein n=1 Tax=hydrothermal vent metagenome TaxID=652676 RepID=A0A3B1C101_9ZZZZ